MSKKQRPALSQGTQMPRRHMHGRPNMHVVSSPTLARGRCSTLVYVGSHVGSDVGLDQMWDQVASNEALRHCGQCTLQRLIVGTGHYMPMHIDG